jgi:hypothetical protein
VGERVGVEVGDCVPVGVGVGVGEFVFEDEGVGDCVGDGVPVGDGEGVLVGVEVGDCVPVGEGGRPSIRGRRGRGRVAVGVTVGMDCEKMSTVAEFPYPPAKRARSPTETAARSLRA